MKAISVATILALATSSVFAGNWPGWRGPASNGIAPGTGFPVKWGVDENIAWKVELPGIGGSTPAVWDDKIFVTSSGDGSNFVTCLNRKGQREWQVTVGTERAGKHRFGTGSNPSPATDGKYVYVYFKSGDFACLDVSGKVVWQNNLQRMWGDDTLWWDLGTSPVLTREHVVIACMQSQESQEGGEKKSPSYLAAFERATGKVAYREDRELGAPVEAAQAYSTPVVINHNDRELIIVLGADHATAHEAKTGKEIWRVGGLNPTNHQYFRSIAGPVVSDGIVIAPYARGNSLTAIKLGGEGDVTQSHIAWFKEGVGADVPTPIALDGKVYNCSDRGLLTCLDIKTGDKLWSVETPKARARFKASPILADGKFYLTREDGVTIVVSIDGKVIAENHIAEGRDANNSTVATPVLTDGKVLIRTFTHLYCVGK